MFFKTKNVEVDLYSRTDGGIFFGWWLCLDGERIAELNYREFDIASQFWCEYSVFPFHPRFDTLGYDPARWSSVGVALESRYVEGFYVVDFVMAPRTPNCVAIRNATIPRDRFDACVHR